MEAVTDFLQTMICPGMLPLTILMGINLLYWSVVAIGMVDLDFMDGALDGVLDGAVDGAADGLIDGALESSDGGLEVAHGAHGPLAVFLSFMNVGEVPITILVSFIIAKSWLLGLIYYTFMPNFLIQFVPEPVSWGIVFFASVIPSLYLTGLSTRPLRRVFKLSTVTNSGSLIGSVCMITSRQVTGTFGTAEVHTDGASLLLNVVCDSENNLNRDAEAVIIDYDPDKDFYTVRPIAVVQPKKLT